MQDAARDRQVAGTVTLVVRDGQVAYFEAAGGADLEHGTPMRTDTIFRIASMTKAVVSVGVMMLVEEGRIALTDPVSKFIPAFAKTTVLATEAGRVAVVPARRPITIRDLLTHTAGISYGMGALEPCYTRRRLHAVVLRRPRPEHERAGWTSWPRCRSNRSPVTAGSTATTPTCSATSSSGSAGRRWRRSSASG